MALNRFAIAAAVGSASEQCAQKFRVTVSNMLRQCIRRTHHDHRH